MRTPSSDRHDVVVVGAGQAGLAAGYHLARRGIDFTILESHDRVGEVWRNRYDSLHLYSPARYDALPGLPLPLAGDAFPTGRHMADYLETYADHHRLPVRTGVRVDRLTASDGVAPFTLSTGERTFEADRVIVATGAFQRPHVPEFASRLDPGIRQLHAADYRGPHQLRDGPVLVVGLSHSGADIAYELSNAGHRTIVSGRSHGQLPFSVDSRRARLAWPVMRFAALNILTLRTPIGRKMAPQVRAGGGPLLRVRRGDLTAAGVALHDARVSDVDGRGRPTLADGTVLDVANVVWCTGFRPDYRWIDLPVIGADGWPRERRGVVGDIPGLYFLGIPFLYSFTSMLVVGADRDAAYVVDHLADTSPQKNTHAAPGRATSGADASAVNPG